MKFVTDENLGIQIPEYLRGLGFDVISVIAIALGEPDPEILKIANQENRILITLDKDFGELVFKYKLIHAGVILFRLKDESIENKKKVILKTLKLRKIFKGKFTVVRDKNRK